jgi:hypothetical protein
MARINLLDLANLTGNDAVVGLIEEVTTVAPEFEVIPARTRKGTSYRVGKRTALPSGGFRDVNAGVAPAKSTYISEVKPMYFFDALLSVDEAIVKADEGELGDILALESSGIVKGSAITLGNQVYNGQAADPKGFNGFVTQFQGTGFEVDATGTSTVESAWLVWLDPNYQGIHFVIGNDGEMDLKPWKQQFVPDPLDATKQYLAWMSNFSFFIGLAMGSAQSLWRVKNINATKPLTDQLGAQLLALVPLARRPGLRWFMSKSAQLGLQVSRYTTSYGGTGFPEPPDTLAGIPITVTDILPYVT